MVSRADCARNGHVLGSARETVTINIIKKKES